MEPALFVEMSCCGAVYELDPEVGKRLLRGEEVEDHGKRSDTSAGWKWKSVDGK